jgi:hypothetical protein
VIERTLLWQGRARPGTEWCELIRDQGGWRIAGIVLTADAGTPARVRYAVTLDDDWATRSVHVDIRAGAEQTERRLHLSVSQDQRWRAQRGVSGEPDAPAEPLPEMQGLFDVDLGFSPVTNTLPIRRPQDAAGGSVELTAVWVRFPELTIETLPQRYTRLADRHYRYESAGGAFVAELTVDDLGLVIDYEGGWLRIAGAEGSGLRDLDHR